jgi:hypothetical protein
VKVNNNLMTTVTPIFNAHAAGSEAAYVVDGHQSTDVIPAVSQVYRWGAWFPAMGVDFGVPNRDLHWRTGSAVTGLQGCSLSLPCADVWRRDYTKAIVLARPYTNGELDPAALAVPSQPMDLGATYYPLLADGASSAGVTGVSLRGGEAVILLKAPR